MSSYQHRMARLKAIEKAETPHWELPCGHTTHRETQLVYILWKPEDKDWYCETCEEWFAKPPKEATRKEIPNEPPF